MNVNWKVRFKNKTFLASFISLIVAFVYNLLGMFEIVPPVTENMVLSLVQSALVILGAVGVIVDPTTAGVSDSQRALTYQAPHRDEPPDAAV